MEYKNAEEMARALVKQYTSATYIRSLVMERFGECPSTKRIAAWRSHFITSDPTYRRTSHNAKPLPSDFAEIAPTMTKSQLMRHYGVLWSGTIDRWLSEANTHSRRWVNRPKPGRINMMGRVKPAPEFKKTKDDYEIAADILRRERFPVNRCNEDGSFNINGKFWRVGRTVLNGEQMMEKAERYGRV